MVKLAMYQEIQLLKAQGWKKSQVARRLAKNRKTIGKYWEAPLEEYLQRQRRSRRKGSFCAVHGATLVRWLREFPDLSAAQIWDWLRKRRVHVQVSQRTVRRTVAALRHEYDLPKTVQPRQYEACEELPPGRQLQVEFGVASVLDAQGKRRKLYGLACILAHSRFKYAEWLDRPLTTLDLTQMLERAFCYIGGVPQELLFDQDRLVLVSERCGDLLPTEVFEAYRQQRGFSFQVCRKADPETKGKVENLVKYLNGNFAKHRPFRDIATWNQQQLAWLERTGNALPHGTTKKVPSSVLPLEKAHFRPIPSGKIPNHIVTAAVRKDNTIVWRGNRYSVPLGTYRPGARVQVRREGTELVLLQEGQVLGRHPLLLTPGQLSKLPAHSRQRERRRAERLEQARQSWADEEWQQYLQALGDQHTRFLPDQLRLLARLRTEHGDGRLREALHQCGIRGLIGASYVEDWLAAQAAEVSPSPSPAVPAKRTRQAYEALVRRSGASRQEGARLHNAKACNFVTWEKNWGLC